MNVSKEEIVDMILEIIQRRLDDVNAYPTDEQVDELRFVLEDVVGHD